MIEGDALLVHPVRGHLYLGLQALRGHPLGRFVRELEGSERLTPAEFDRLHDQRLRDILAYARERVPLYRTEPWQTALRDRGDAIDAWPVLERDVVQAHADELRALPRGRRDVELRSSGSTGRPVAIALTREAETWTWAHRYRMMMWHGVAIGAPSLRLSHDRHGLRDRLLGHTHLPPLATTEARAAAGRYLRRARRR